MPPPLKNIKVSIIIPIYYEKKMFQITNQI